MSDRESGPGDGAVLEHVRRALRHGEEAIRCWLSLIGKRAAAFGLSIARLVAWFVVFAIVAAAGLLFTAYGLARWLEHWLGLAPGVGSMFVGLAMLGAVAAACFIVVRKGKGGES